MSVKIAVLWDREIDFESNDPLEEKLSETYRVFSEMAERKGGKVYISNFRFFENEELSRAVCYEEGEWRQKSEVEIDAVFDKYKFDGETKPLKKKITENMHVINQYGLEKICKDKLLTYQRFPDLVPETEVGTEQNVKRMLSNNSKVILKPRFDYGGKGVELIDSMDEFEKRESQLVQAFVDSSHGHSELGVEGVHDLRLLVVNGSPEVAYLRLAEEGFISNVSMGGSIKFIEMEDVPEKALEVVEDVSEVLGEWDASYYSVDLIFDSEKNPHILELNSKPALNFHGDSEIRKWKEPVMEKVVDILLEVE